MSFLIISYLFISLFIYHDIYKLNFFTYLMEFRLYRNLSYSHFYKKCCYLISNTGIYLYKKIFAIQLTLFFIRYIRQKEDIYHWIQEYDVNCRYYFLSR